ncbi:hypothetical protein CVU37_02475 [candidate division BRC1 bacterium HGW-BRC1-1]|nr:MAG: hypothetical protein CVU37_02475 [candidate division BRC1 bacterium HGW-BRC1-1]
MTNRATHTAPADTSMRTGARSLKTVRFLFTLLVLVTIPGMQNIQAAPVAGEGFELAQPDGTYVSTRIWGDEFYQVVESLDGYTLVRDPKTQVICYGEVSADGTQLISTGARVGTPRPTRLAPHLRIDPTAATAQATSRRASFTAGTAQIDALNRAQRSTPGSIQADAPILPANTDNGNVHGVCIIVDFSDSIGTITPTEVDNFCNLIGYRNNSNTGSIREYYRDVSLSNLDYTNYVPPVYYRALQPKSYYDNPAEEAGPKARELVTEALTWLDQVQGFDFSQCDSNNDGYVDAVNVFYAGSVSSGWSKGLWPHQWSVYFNADGVSTRNYQITDMKAALQIRTFLHENGHMICGWPDLYDYGSESYGIGNYCLMGYGGGSNTNPVPPCPYFTARAGWADLRMLTMPITGLPAPSAANVVYRYNRPGVSNEYFLVNNLQKTGRGSRYPDAGLAVWHIDEYGSNNNEAMTTTSHYKVTLVQSDNNWDLEKKKNYGDSNDLYDAASRSVIDSSTAPNSNWWNDSPSAFKIDNVSASSANMTFDFGDMTDLLAPVASCSVLDSTRAGATSLDVKFTAMDIGFSGLALTRLWARTPGATNFVDTGVTIATATSGTLTFTQALDDGIYEFAVQAIDVAGNASPVPTSAQATVLLNVEARSSFTQVVKGGAGGGVGGSGGPTGGEIETLLFPVTDDMNLTLRLTNAAVGSTITVTGHSERGAAPEGINYPGLLVDRRMEIVADGLGAFTASMEWPLTTAETAPLAGNSVDAAFRVVGGVVQDQFPVSYRQGTATVEGITAFSTWYIGNSAAVPVTVSQFSID